MDPSGSKENEIRTRARAEEKRERFKIVDNLTRVIDDVALNYSANHDGEEMPRNADKRKSIGTTPTGAIWSEGGEITVKSFAKISNNTPQNQQRARKSFPTPSSSKTFAKQPQISILKRDSSSNSSSAAAVTSTPNVSSKENSSTSTSSVSSSTIQNQIQNNTTSQITITTTNSSSATTTTNTTSSSSSSSSSISSTSLRTVVPPQSTHSTLTVNHSAITAGLNSSSVTLSSISSCSIPSRPHEGINVSTVPHVILFPNPTVNYGSPIVSPMIGMVSIIFLKVICGVQLI